MLTIAQNITLAWPWIPTMRAGRPFTAAQWVPHRSQVTGLPPITGERFRPKQGGKASCL
ncbi:MAG: hypothetical protein Q8R93_00615 [Methylicorpusculum sp.]|uniref:hypothetical protein n=1 Tax=Methylicorpusculum sp. TaxID=2713644 RepID=UPI002730FC46|nr:hypothetical protein [Methylicorpusculum sp.]MDP3527784.1 hypothetical protein [Methylicorpusculum sp.]MDZ4153286.1 hypothetical protein [Methylicorpusculum sp.]